MVNYIKGDLFTHKPTPGTKNVLVHACNCKGSWGAGIAAVFRRKFPECYKTHQKYCEKFKDSSQLLGTCQVIESVPSEPGHNLSGPTLVVCLFTSDFFGGEKLPPDEIVHYTKKSLEALAGELGEFQGQLDRNDGKVVLNMPQINAGLFGVPWENTVAVFPETFTYNVYVL